MSKRLLFNDICNFRDLGGMNKANGEETKAGVLYRSSMLFGKDEADFKKLKELAIQTIIDLRSPSEIERVPNPYKDEVTNYLTINISGTKDIGRSAKMSQNADTPHFMYKRYMEYVSDAKDQIKTIFDYFLNPENLPAIFHCSAGKDRTGVISYLIQSLNGVPTEEIVADYQVSYTYIKHDARIIKDDHVLNLVYSYPEIMELFDEAFKDKYGSTENYFKQLGYSDEEIHQLKAII